jgi:hypothetical protein
VKEKTVNVREMKTVLLHGQQAKSEKQQTKYRQVSYDYTSKNKTVELFVE